MKTTTNEGRTDSEQSTDNLTPTPYEIASLAVKLSKTKPSEQLPKAYDLWIAADEHIKARVRQVADETAASTELSRTFVPDLLGTPIKFDEIIREKLLPKAAGEKGVETAIRTRKGLISSLTAFFEKCVPIPPVPEDFPAGQIKKLSQDYLIVIISDAEMPRHLFNAFKQWRTKRLENKTRSDSSASVGPPVNKKSSVPDGN